MHRIDLLERGANYHVIVSCCWLVPRLYYFDDGRASLRFSQYSGVHLRIALVVRVFSLYHILMT